MRSACCSIIVIASLSLAPPALAQTDSTGRVGITVKHDSVTPLPPRAQTARRGTTPEATATTPEKPAAPQRDTTCPCYKYIGPYSLIGMAIGAGVGFTTAYVISHGRHGSYVDHSEDGWAYQFFATAGGVVGLVVGLVLGVRHQ
jgi:hypothetical protein